MKRDFLEDLNLEKETIDKIMAEYGKSITSEQEKYTSLEKEISNYKSAITDYEKQVKDLNNKIQDNEKSLENMQALTNENKDLKADIQMNGSKVKSEFSKFVKSEVMANVNDETDFTTALENFKKDNPQYFGDVVVKKVQSSPTLNAGEPKPQTTSDIMNNILRGAKNNE